MKLSRIVVIRWRSAWQWAFAEPTAAAAPTGGSSPTVHHVVIDDGRLLDEILTPAPRTAPEHPRR